MADTEKAFEVDYHSVTIKTIDGSTINGRVNIVPDKRVSDLLRRNDGEFLVVVDASTMEWTGKTLFINKNHIVWIEPNA